MVAFLKNPTFPENLKALDVADVLEVVDVQMGITSRRVLECPRRHGRNAVDRLVVVDVVVVDGFVFNRSLFSVMNGLQLVAIGQVSVVGGRDDVVLVVGFSSQELVLSGGFEVVCCSTVMFGCVVMNFVLVCGCHNDLNVLNGDV
jgi:hypothetical protein